MHIKLNNRKPFGRHFQSGEIGNRLFGNQNPAGMHAALVGKFFQQHSVFLNEFDYMAVFMQLHRILGEMIQLFFRQTKCFSHFPENGTVLKFYIRSAESNMVFSILIENIL